jgi:hypothetical protein
MNVANIIEFYKPHNFRTNAKWIPAEQRGKIVLFVPDGKNQLAARVSRIQHDEHCCGGSTSLPIGIFSAKLEPAKYKS